MDVRLILGRIFHVCFLSHHLYIWWYGHKIQTAVGKLDVRTTDQDILDIKTFASLFFTNWNLLIQTIYFSLAVFYDILQIYSLHPKLRRKINRWKGVLFTTFVFPCTIYVSSTFWLIYSINREWIFPEICDEFVPGWLNHSIHTLIIVFLIIEVLTTNHEKPSFKNAFIAVTVLTVIYVIVFFSTYFIAGRFVYALFRYCNWAERILFFPVVYVYSVIVMRIGFAIENFKYSLAKSTAKKLKI